MSSRMNATAGPSRFPGSLSSDAHGKFFFASFFFRKLLIFFTFTEIDSSATTTKKRKRIDDSTENVTRCSRGVRPDYRLLNDPFLAKDDDLSSKKRICLRSSSRQMHSILPRPRTSNVSIQSSTPSVRRKGRRVMPFSHQSTFFFVFDVLRQPFFFRFDAFHRSFATCRFTLLR